MDGGRGRGCDGVTAAVVVLTCGCVIVVVVTVGGVVGDAGVGVDDDDAGKNDGFEFRCFFRVSNQATVTKCTKIS